jgi:hypothetical protein
VSRGTRQSPPLRATPDPQPLTADRRDQDGPVALDQPEPFAHDERGVRDLVLVSAPVSESSRAPVLGGGAPLTLIDGELQAHAFQRHDLNPRDFDGAAGFIEVADQNKSFAGPRQRVRRERLIHRPETGRGSLFSAEDEVDQPASHLGASKAELVGRERSAFGHESMIAAIAGGGSWL